MSEEKHEYSADWVQSVYKQGFEDGLVSGKNVERENTEVIYQEGVRNGERNKEAQLGKYAMIGKAFCDWVGDDAEKVKNRDDVYDILDDINEGGKIVVGDEVMYGKSRAIVTKVYSANGTCNIFLNEENNFGETLFTSRKGLKKTGNHYDVISLVKK